MLVLSPTHIPAMLNHLTQVKPSPESSSTAAPVLLLNVCGGVLLSVHTADIQQTPTRTHPHTPRMGGFVDLSCMKGFSAELLVF